jgi:hypothetical protein
MLRPGEGDVELPLPEDPPDEETLCFVSTIESFVKLSEDALFELFEEVSEVETFESVRLYSDKLAYVANPCWNTLLS